MRTLRHGGTKLRFITNMDRSSESLDVISNLCCSLFHLAFSLAMHSSLIILNNSIIGFPSDDLEKLISWLQRHGNVDNKQIIVVQHGNIRLNVSGFHFIHCPYDDGTNSSSS